MTLESSVCDEFSRSRNYISVWLGLRRRAQTVFGRWTQRGGVALATVRPSPLIWIRVSSRVRTPIITLFCVGLKPPGAERERSDICAGGSLLTLFVWGGRLLRRLLDGELFERSWDEDAAAADGVRQSVWSLVISDRPRPADGARPLRGARCSMQSDHCSLYMRHSSAGSPDSDAPRYLRSIWSHMSHQVSGVFFFFFLLQCSLGIYQFFSEEVLHQLKVKGEVLKVPYCPHFRIFHPELQWSSFTSLFIQKHL